MGLRHPLKHLRGKAIQSLRSEGIQVDVVGEDLQSKLFKVTLGLYVHSQLLFLLATRQSSSKHFARGTLPCSAVASFSLETIFRSGLTI